MKLRRLFLKSIGYLHYIGFLLILFMLIEARQTAYDSNQTLRGSIYRQKTLRNLLWINLLMQKATNLVIKADGAADLERAQTIAVSLIPYMVELSKPESGLSDTTRETVERKVKEFQSILGSLPASKLYKTLYEITNNAGEELNRIEAQEWYILHAENLKLLAQVEKNHANLMRMFGLFIGYLLFLGWIINAKNRVEVALSANEAKMMNSAKMSALGEMAGGVAHEINNPLSMIALTVSQLQEVVQEEPLDRPTVVQMTQMIEETVKRITAIVQGLKTFSRDGSKDQFESVYINEIIATSLNLCQEKMKHNSVKVDLYPISNDFTVECQAVQISQVFLNLISNACDAIATLSEKWIKISAKREGDFVQISITDSGKGIPKQNHEKIFQPFFTTKAVGSGTGLGLSISKGIIESHHGTLSLDTKCANTKFIISLPLKVNNISKVAA